MVDVIYFDYWLRGTRHFKFIEDELKRKNRTSLLLHTGSWREGKPIVTEEVYNDILCRDIAYYDYSIIKALKQESPKVVILLNQQTEDRIIVRYCRSHGIRTVYLMHGVLANDTTLSSKTLDSAFGLSDRLKRFGKYRILFVEYLKAFNQSFFLGFLNPQLYLYFTGLFISPGKINYNVWKFRDAYADLALVYSEFDFDLFTKKMGFQKENVRIVGNYNMDELFYKKKKYSNDAKFHEKILTDLGCPQKLKYVLFVEGGFFTPGYIIPGWSIDAIAQQLRQVAVILNELDLALIVKLHPSSDYGDLEEIISDIPNLVLTSSYDLDLLTMGAVAVLGQSSSALRLSVILGVPLLIHSFEPLKLIFQDYIDNNFGTLVCNYDELQEKLQLILDGKFQNSIGYKANLKYFLEPFDGKSRERISEIILSLCN